MKIKSGYIEIFFLIVILSTIAFSGAGCSSSEAAKKEKKKIEEKLPVLKLVKNLDELEREYISSERITSIEKIKFDYDNNGKLSNREKLSKIVYDENGFQKETIIYNKEENISFKYVYQYIKGRRVKTLRYNAEGVYDKTYTYAYNKQGNKIRSESLSNDGALEKFYIYEYNDESKLIKDIWFDQNGKKEYMITYEYDKKGRKESSYSYNEEDELVAKYVYRYDDEDNIVEEVRYGAEDNVQGIIQYVYYH